MHGVVVSAGPSAGKQGCDVKIPTSWAGNSRGVGIRGLSLHEADAKAAAAVFRALENNMFDDDDGAKVVETSSERGEE